MAQGNYLLRIDAGQLKVFIGTLDTLETNTKLVQVIKRGAEMVRQQAVINVGGYPVTFDGRFFRVMVRTGTLKGSIETAWPYGGSPLTAKVFVNGTHTAPSKPGGMVGKAVPVSEYAGAVEWGHKAIDLKLTMMGKIVPFFASRGFNTYGPFSVRGLKPNQEGQDDVGDFFHNPDLNAKLAAQGKAPMNFQKRGGKSAYEGGKKGGGSYYIAFRRVGKTGWIIPEAQPRPFMRAALAKQTPPISRLVKTAVKETLQEAAGG
jgi:hypothetical protein